MRPSNSQRGWLPTGGEIPYVEATTRDLERRTAIEDNSLSAAIRATCAELDARLRVFEEWVDRNVIPARRSVPVMNEVEPLEVTVALVLRQHRHRVASEQSVIDAIQTLHRAIVRVMNDPSNNIN